MMNLELDKDDSNLIKQALRKVRFIIDSNNGSLISFFKDGNIDFELIYAIMKALEYIGEMLNPEAKYHIPISRWLVTKHNNIAWKRITYIRNRFEHNYSREILPIDIINSLEDLIVLDKQLKGILITYKVQLDKFFEHKDHNIHECYKEHLNRGGNADDFFANKLFDKIKGEDKLTDQQNLVCIEKNYNLLKLFSHDVNIAFLNRDENRLLREKKISAIERVIEIIGQASKEVSDDVMQKITKMLIEVDQASLMKIWISLRAKRDTSAHLQKPPDLASTLQSSRVIVDFHIVIVAFLAKEYNYTECELYKHIGRKIDKLQSEVAQIKAAYEEVKTKLTRITVEYEHPEINKAIIEKEYQDQILTIQKLENQRKELQKAVEIVSSEINKKIITLFHTRIANQIESLNKLLQDLQVIFLENDKKIVLISKDYQDKVLKSAQVLQDEKRKLPEKMENISKLSVEEEERQKKKKNEVQEVPPPQSNLKPGARKF